MTISAGACGDGGDRSAGGPRDRELVATVEAVWRAAGVDPNDAFLGGYDHQTHENTRLCQHLLKDDRWYAARTSQLPSNVTAQGKIYQGVLAYFEREGFTVERYEARAPEVHRPALRAAKADLAVLVTVAEDGNTFVDVSAGPCAVPTATFSKDMYVQVG
jgi:hypothetical protein